MTRRPLTLPSPLAAVAVICLGIGAYLAIFAFTPSPPRHGYIPGRPLLETDGQEFVDSQIKLRFTPPPKWGMQMRSTEAPNSHPAERRVVKYKRLIEGPRVAWMRVMVADAPADAKPADLLRQRKPPEANWTVTKEMEDGLTIGGQPAARLTYGGMLDPDREGPRHCTCELVVSMRGQRAFIFAGTYTTGDEEAQQQFRAAVQSVRFD